MASAPCIITIESGDEDDDVIFLGETCASASHTTSTTTTASCHVKVESSSNSDKENNSEDSSVVIMDSPPKKSDFKISKTKLQTLRGLFDKTQSINKKLPMSHAKGDEVPKVAAQQHNKLKIDKARLKRLRAVIKIELENHATSPRPSDKEEKMDTSSSSDLPFLKTNDLGNGFPPSPSSSPVSPENLCSKVLNYSVTKDSTTPVKKLTQSPLEKYFALSDKKSPRSKYLMRKSPKKSRLPAQKSLDFSADNKDLLDTSKNSEETPKLVVKRNEVLWPPTHIVLNQEEFVRKLFQRQKLLCTSFVDSVECIQEEKFYYAAIKMLQRLMSTGNAPPCTLVRLVVEDILMKSRSRSVTIAAYCTLMDIHEQHPASCIAMDIEWKQVRTLWKSILSPGKERNSQHSLNATLVLAFFLVVLSSEMKSVALKSKPTRITRILSANCDMQKVKDVISGFRDCLCNHGGTGKVVKVRTTSHGRSRCKVKSLHSASINVLDSLQSLLKFIMISSTNKQYVSIRIADELMYLYMDLPTLDARVQLLRTLKSHLIRRLLIEVLLMNYCALEPEALQSPDIPMSIRKIVLQDFHRHPPQRSKDVNSQYATSEEVEEYVTLVAYLLQSYIALHSNLQAFHSDFPSYRIDQFKQFTEEDVTYLANLAPHVSALKIRCEGFIAQSEKLNPRTCLLLEMLETLS